MFVFVIYLGLCFVLVFHSHFPSLHVLVISYTHSPVFNPVSDTHLVIRLPTVSELPVFSVIVRSLLSFHP